jgi:hypothetical protein
MSRKVYHGERSPFMTSHNPHHSTDQHQTWQDWWPRPYHKLCEFWCWSDQRGRLGNMVKYNEKFLPFFSPSIPTSTRNRGPIFVFDTSNDVFPCVYVQRLIDIVPNSNLGGHFPRKTPFFPKSWLFATVVLKQTCRPNRLTNMRRKWLKWRHCMVSTYVRCKNHWSSHRGGLVP